ncbi:Lrp/AsnC family transcriptional regulator [Bacillus sp. PR5]|nr:Lrp/AsnC family transcriptional regulator [Bacillus sp. PR5]
MSAIFRHQKRRRSDRHFAGMDRYIYGSTKEPTMRELDAKDREILAILSKEARIPLKTLAGRIGLSRSATGERVANLEKNGVIRGYRADIGQIDKNVIRAMILVSLKRTPALGLLDELARHAEVRRVSSVSGQLDLIVEVEVPSIDRLNSLRDLIATHETVEDLTTAIVLRRDIERETV